MELIGLQMDTSLAQLAGKRFIVARSVQAKGIDNDFCRLRAGTVICVQALDVSMPEGQDHAWASLRVQIIGEILDTTLGVRYVRDLDSMILATHGRTVFVTELANLIPFTVPYFQAFLLMIHRRCGLSTPHEVLRKALPGVDNLRPFTINSESKPAADIQGLRIVRVESMMYSSWPDGLTVDKASVTIADTEDAMWNMEIDLEAWFSQDDMTSCLRTPALHSNRGSYEH